MTPTRRALNLPVLIIGQFLSCKLKFYLSDFATESVIAQYGTWVITVRQFARNEV